MADVAPKDRTKEIEHIRQEIERSNLVEQEKLAHGRIETVERTRKAREAHSLMLRLSALGDQLSGFNTLVLKAKITEWDALIVEFQILQDSYNSIREDFIHVILDGREDRASVLPRLVGSNVKYALTKNLLMIRSAILQSKAFLARYFE